MTKIVLPSVTGANNQSIVNDNFKKIEDALNEGVLWREGGDNSVKGDIDFNGKRLYNLPAPTAPHEPVRLIDLEPSNKAIGGGIPEAPVDGFVYGRKNAEWSRIESSSGGSGGLVGYAQYGPAVALVTNSTLPKEEIAGYEGWRAKPAEGMEEYVNTLNAAGEGFVLDMQGTITIPDGELVSAQTYLNITTGTQENIRGNIIIFLVDADGGILPLAMQPYLINVSPSTLPVSMPFPFHLPYRKVKAAYGEDLKLGYGITVDAEPTTPVDFRIITVMTCLK